MKIEASKLYNVLQIFSQASRGSFDEEAKYCFFEEGSCLFYSSPICIKYPLQSDLNCIVSLKLLLDMVSKVEGDVELSVLDEKVLRVELGDLLVGKLELVSLGLGKGAVDLEEPAWKELPPGFLDGLSFCVKAVSTDPTSGNLTGVYIGGDKIVGMDNLRCSRCKLESQVGDKFIVPSLYAPLLVDLGVSEYFYKDNLAYFKSSSGAFVRISCLLGDYPDCDYLFSFDGVEVDFENVGEIEKVLSKMDIFLRGMDFLDQLVRVRISDEGLACSCSRVGVGGLESKPIPVGYRGREIEFLVNPKYFLEVVKSGSMCVGDDKVKFEQGNLGSVVALCCED